MKIMYKCFMCGREYQHSEGIYDGRKCEVYDFIVCNRCFEFNWDGWSIGDEEKILKHLRSKGIEPPKRNGKGLFPRGEYL